MSADTAPIAGRQLWGRITRFMWGFKRQIGAAIGLSLLASLAFALLPWPIRYLIDGVLLSDELRIPIFGSFDAASTGDKLGLAVALAAAFLAIQVTAAVMMSASFYWFAKAALLMIHELRGSMLRHLRSLSIGYHANTSTGDTIFRSINDARAIQEVMIFGVQAWILPIFQVVLMVGFMLVLDVWLTIAAVIVSPLLVVAIRRLTGSIQAASARSRGHMGELTSLIEQTTNSIRAVQVFGTEGDEADKFDETSNRFISAQLRFRMAEQALSVTTMLITGLGTALVLYVASRRVIDTALTVGALWIFINYMQRIYEVLQQNMNLFGVLQDSLVGVGRAFEVLDTEPDIVDADGAVDIGPPEGSIRFEGVTLDYSDGDGDGGPALVGVDLEVAVGERIAIVGPTGAGKTSLLNMLPRLYDPTDGSITIDGVDLRDATISSLRSLISIVPQEPMLFATSVADNIEYGRRQASRAEIEAAATAARAHDFILELDDGYETNVGDRGAKLSVGQQQRVAIARAFLKDAPILLLDEPTSALDLSTEADFLAGLDQLMAGRTVFIVAHRLSTVRSADRIVVLDRGRISEVGTHDELLAAGGLYAQLWNRQFAS